MAIASGCTAPAPLIAELTLAPGCFSPQTCTTGDTDCEQAQIESIAAATKAADRIRAYPAVVREIRQAPEQTEWEVQQPWAPPHDGATTVTARVVEESAVARHLALEVHSTGVVRFDGDQPSEIDWQEEELLHFGDERAEVSRLDAEIGDETPVAWTADVVRVGSFARGCDPTNATRFEASDYTDEASWRCWASDSTAVDCAAVRVDVP